MTEDVERQPLLGPGADSVTSSGLVSANHSAVLRVIDQSQDRDHGDPHRA